MKRIYFNWEKDLKHKQFSSERINDSSLDTITERMRRVNIINTLHYYITLLSHSTKYCCAMMCFNSVTLKAVQFKLTVIFQFALSIKTWAGFKSSMSIIRPDLRNRITDAHRAGVNIQSHHSSSKCEELEWEALSRNSKRAAQHRRSLAEELKTLKEN